MKPIFNLRKTILAAFLMLPGLSHAWWNDKWPNRVPVAIDTSKAGASIDENLSDATVLVKLHTGNFQDFFTLKDDVSDLRFIADDDKTPLKFHVESADIVNQLIYVWVKIPKVAASVNSGRIWMYYGNAEATAGQDSAGTYDINTSAVYHFKNGEAIPQDSSTNKVNASAATATINNSSQIAAGLKFDNGQSITIAESPVLSVAAAQGATYSFWVKPSSLQTDAYVFNQRGANSEFIIGIEQNNFYARLQLPNGRVLETNKSPSIRVGEWQHIAVILDATKLTLLVDGKEIANAPAQLVDFGGAITLGNSAQGAHAFIGELDEVRIDHVVRSAGWIALAVTNQGMENKLVRVNQAEQLGSGGGGSGFWKVIIGSQDEAGWVIIGLLALMAVINWAIMIGKAFYIRSVNKDNVQFLNQYRALGDRDPALLDRDDSEEDKALENSPITQALFGDHDHFQSSPIYRVYHRGVQELRARVGTSVGARAAGLTQGAINSIRATLDTQMVLEQQRLNSKLVLLTIGIAGGPFIGLLGTVIGVMIVFAAIAASGDVNISAIAPGVAAALAATVMGLLVAIPSLFGYNYLMAQIKTSVSDMQVFANEFVTRLAEYYGDK
ncbi:MAG: MotA/TolQ/ExbB proton channel family protein [Spongiibacteraceae bacterium]